MTQTCAKLSIPLLECRLAREHEYVARISHIWEVRELTSLFIGKPNVLHNLQTIQPPLGHQSL